MVCSGINPPARGHLDAYLRRERGIDLPTYLDALLDIRNVGPAYVGPPLGPQEDIWGVRRKPVAQPRRRLVRRDRRLSPGGLRAVPADLDAHRWPSTDWYDYSTLPARIAARAMPTASTA